jgi:hypothetical protein
MVGAMWVVAVITFGSGVMVAVRLDETLKRRTAERIRDADRRSVEDMRLVAKLTV